MPTTIESHYAGNDRYPNSRSYAMSSFSGRGTNGGTKLRRAVLYSAKKSSGYEYENGTVQKTTEIVTTLRKPFQFNPPNIPLGIRMAPTDPEETLLDGGTEAGAYLGAAGTSVEMLFERSIEVHANSGEYGRLGMAKDVLDVIAVLRGDPTLLDANDDKSIRELTHSMTDLVSNGSNILMTHRAAIVYSPDLVLYGLVTEMSIRFVQFNRDFIPTMGYVDLTFDIHNASSMTGVASEMVGVNNAQATTSTLQAANGYNVTDAWGGNTRRTPNQVRGSMARGVG